MKAVVLTLTSLIAFAGNSIVCRMALGSGIIDPASFTSIRLLSGAVTLVVLHYWVSYSTKKASVDDAKGSWRASLALFLYALCFSYAYLSLQTATGALILFAAVQITMLLLSALKGTKLHWTEWLGTIAAFAGFVYLVAPELATPSLKGLVLMSISGIAWGLYTLAGRGSTDPLSDTMHNFVRTMPMLLVLTMATAEVAVLSSKGVALALASGALMSGLGYAIWYQVLRQISAVQAAVVQLSVPVIAALGGVIFVGEAIDLRLMTSALIILGGILMVILGKRYALPS
ncbi:DMT family transporter [Ferrimonas aestuarii]|uniref:DMT family transporter n=1 Tax=Ferrimonas aestuarii TaxID=2569539 RepID=A0A4U1BKF4_9GAMM|nr:DMT family transporter [Ferrimonas aestuarii]TKB51953.1 DMT family transporter [Ferrimonas aestuarii]